MSKEKIIGIMSETANFFGRNICLPLLLSMKDREMLSTKYSDISDWVEMKLWATDVIESKKGTSRCWLVSEKSYQKALAEAGYANKRLSPINKFEPNERLVLIFQKGRNS